MYIKNYITQMKVVKTQINGKIPHVHGLLKGLYYPKQFTDSMQPYQNPNGLFYRTRNIILKCERNHTQKKHPNSENNIKEQSWRPQIS